MAPSPARVFWLCLCAAACERPSPEPHLTAVVPGRGYSDVPLRVMLMGDSFVPTFRLAPGDDLRRGDASGFSGRATAGAGAADLRDFDWLGPGQLSAWLEPGLPRGKATVVLRDPRGRTATLEGGFDSLGRDLDAPVIEWLRPPAGTPLAPGATVAVSLRAADAAPGVLAELGWQVSAAGTSLSSGSCPDLPSTAAVRCDFDVTAPDTLAVGSKLTVTVTARDGSAGRNPTITARVFDLVSRPYIVSIDPESGSTLGGTDVVVEGNGFLPGTQVVMGNRILKSTVVDEHSIATRTPASEAAGVVAVTVIGPLGESALANGFRYQEPPAIGAISPETGDPAGGTVVRVFGHGFGDDTRVYFGDDLADCQPLLTPIRVSDTEITGVAPAGQGRTSVWVFDDELGWSTLPGGFGWSKP
jgi:hypothetical protein